MNKKTLIIIGSSVIGFIILLLVVIWLIGTLKPKYYDYETVEEKIKNATEKYYNANIETMPADNGKYSLDYSKLVEGEYIKPLNELLKDGDSCTVSIIIIKNDESISYMPYLTCGEDYQTIELSKKILEDNTVVSEDAGLYQNETGEYYFRGKVTNNYVSFGSLVEGDKVTPYLWRIMSIKNGIVTLKAETSFEEKTRWDDRYNIGKNKTVGYNDFETSLLKEFLTNMSNEDSYLTSDEKIKLNLQTLCIGSRKADDITKDGTSECSVKSKDEYYYRTMYPYELIRSSLDPNCLSINTQSCVNLNYLAEMSTNTEWLITTNTEVDYQAYYYYDGIITAGKTNSNKRIYPVIELNEYAFYKTGTGTSEDPYIIR